MREQSHLDAMRDAIRGDLERARSRNPSIFEHVAVQAAPAEPEPVPEEKPEPVLAAVPPLAEPEPEAVPEPEAAPEPEPELEAEPEPEAIPDAEPDLEPEPAVAEATKPGLLARLAFWRS
jgi:hypothetical protein